MDRARDRPNAGRSAPGSAGRWRPPSTMERPTCMQQSIREALLKPHGLACGWPWGPPTPWPGCSPRDAACMAKTPWSTRGRSTLAPTQSRRRLPGGCARFPSPRGRSCLRCARLTGPQSCLRWRRVGVYKHGENVPRALQNRAVTVQGHQRRDMFQRLNYS